MKIKIQAIGPCFAIIPSSDCCDKSIFTVENASPSFSLDAKGDLCDTFIELYLATFMKGDQGDSPYIGENGNWWIGTTDTGVKAQGDPGSGTTTKIEFTTSDWVTIAGGFELSLVHGLEAEVHTEVYSNGAEILCDKTPFNTNTIKLIVPNDYRFEGYAIIKN